MGRASRKNQKLLLRATAKTENTCVNTWNTCWYQVALLELQCMYIVTTKTDDDLFHDFVKRL